MRRRIGKGTGYQFVFFFFLIFVGLLLLLVTMDGHEWNCTWKKADD